MPNALAREPDRSTMTAEGMVTFRNAKNANGRPLWHG